MRRISVKVIGRGFVNVPDRWTDDEIEAKPLDFDDAVLDALIVAIEDSLIEFELDDAVPEDS